MTDKHIDFEAPDFGELSTPPAVLPSYRAALLALSPSAYWPLDETQGTTLGDLTSASPLSLTGSFALGQPAAHEASPGGAVQLSGGLASSAGAVLPTTAGAAWSIVFWARRSGAVKIGSILGQFEANTPGRLVIRMANKGRLKVEIDTGPSLLSSFKLGTLWRHVVLTRSVTGLVSWHINGELDASAVLGSDAIADVTFALGSVSAPALPVELDEVAVFPTELDAVTLRWLYRLSAGIPTTSIAS